jgi:uncharacterized protein
MERNTAMKLLNAIEIGQASIAKRLIEAGHDVNEFSLSGNCPILEAASRNDTKLVELLLEHGADPLVEDRKGHTPLHWAQKNKNEHMEEIIQTHLTAKPTP